MRMEILERERKRRGTGDGGGGRWWERRKDGGEG